MRPRARKTTTASRLASRKWLTPGGQAECGGRIRSLATQHGRILRRKWSNWPAFASGKTAFAILSKRVPPPPVRALAVRQGRAPPHRFAEQFHATPRQHCLLLQIESWSFGRNSWSCSSSGYTQRLCVRQKQSGEASSLHPSCAWLWKRPQKPRNDTRAMAGARRRLRTTTSTNFAARFTSSVACSPC